MFDLSEKRALVTGASGGIGSAIARSLHQQGAKVVLSGTRKDVLNDLVNSLGQNAHAVICDLASAAGIQQLADSIDPQIIQLHYEIALNALSKFHVHPHPKQALELCILRMLAFQPISEGAAPKIEKKNSKLVTKQPITPKKNVVEVEIPKPESKSKQVSVDEGSTKELMTEEPSIPSALDMQSWNAIFNSLNLSMFVSQVFSEFEFVSFTDHVLTLKKSDELINPTEGLKTEFLEAISAQLGQKISLIIESGEVMASPAAVEVERVQNQLNQDKDALLENAAVKDILDSFGGKIIDESIKKVSP